MIWQSDPCDVSHVAPADLQGWSWSKDWLKRLKKTYIFFNFYIYNHVSSCQMSFIKQFQMFKFSLC